VVCVGAFPILGLRVFKNNKLPRATLGDAAASNRLKTLDCDRYNKHRIDA